MKTWSNTAVAVNKCTCLAVHTWSSQLEEGVHASACVLASHVHELQLQQAQEKDDWLMINGLSCLQSVHAVRDHVGNMRVTRHPHQVNCGETAVPAYTSKSFTGLSAVKHVCRPSSCTEMAGRHSFSVGPALQKA